MYYRCSLRWDDCRNRIYQIRHVCDKIVSYISYIGYWRQPYFIATMVYFIFPFNIYNVQTNNTKYYLLSLPYIFFNDI